jgi:hypothetical protein
MEERTYYEMIDLVEDMFTEVYNGKHVATVVFYDKAKELLEMITSLEEVELVDIRLTPYEFDLYDKEYYVSITPENEIFVEPAYSNGRYLADGMDVLFIDNDANSRIIQICDYEKAIAFEFDDGDCEPDEECKGCEFYDHCFPFDCCEDDDDEEDIPKIHFTFNTDDAEKLALEPDLYLPLLYMIGEVFEKADYNIDEDGLHIDVNTECIFDMMCE